MPRDLQPFRYAILAAGISDSELGNEELREIIMACREKFPLLETEAFP